jgi:uncharacterized membrane protein YgcG
MAYRKDTTPNLEAEGPLHEQVVGIDLHEGWNLIANPFDESISSSNIYISTAGTRFSIEDLAQSETEHELWNIDITEPQYRVIETLEPFQGAWLHVNNEAGAELIFYRGRENLDTDDVVFQDASGITEGTTLSEAKLLGLAKSRHASSSLYPPSRPGSFSASSSSSGGGSSGGGGGGCLLK